MSEFQLNIYSAALLTILFSYFLNLYFLRIAKNFTFKNNQEQKRLVNNNVPPIGGLATSISFLIFVRLLGKTDSEFMIIGLFGVMLSVIGILDDFYNLNWKFKLSSQVLFVLLPVVYLDVFINFEALLGVDLGNILNIAVSVTWIVLLINAINFIDNMDGLAVVVTGSICIQFILFTYYLDQNKLTDISIILLFSILGFLILNFPPAKIYLGDSGSMFIGFCLGFLSILFTWNAGGQSMFNYTITPALLFFTIPVLDFFIIFDYRVRNKISPTVGGTDHISHRLLNLGLSETKTLSMFFIYSFICFVLISISALQGSMISFSIYLFILFATFIYVRKLEILN